MFTKLASKIFNLFLLLLYFLSISFGKIIKEISFATFDVILHYLLRKRTRIRRLTKQITTIEKKKQTNKLKRRLYNLTMCDKRTLIYVKTIYITKFRNRTILNLDSKNNLQNLITIKATTFATKLKIALKVF